MAAHDIAKALEIWTLQNMFDLSIALGLLAFGLIIVQGYYREIQNHFSLRLSAEMWRATTVVMADVMLVLTVLIGYMVLNPDIMADIKIAIPFCPLATVLFAAALVYRLFYKGHEVGTLGHRLTVGCLLVANLLNIIGFTFVMEGPGDEYLERYPSPFWTYVKTHLRSNAVDGLWLAQMTFYICFALLMVVFIWGVWAALKTARRVENE